MISYGLTLVLVKLLSWLKMLKLMLGIWLTLEFVMHHQQVPIVMLSTYELSIICIYFIKCYLNTLNLWNTCKQGFFGDRAVFCHNANTKSLWRSFIRFNKQNTPVWSWIYILTKTKIRVFCLFKLYADFWDLFYESRNKRLFSNPNTKIFSTKIFFMSVRLIMEEIVLHEPSFKYWYT